MRLTGKIFLMFGLIASSVFNACRQQKVELAKTIKQTSKVGLAKADDIAASEHDAEFAGDFAQISLFQIEIAKLALFKTADTNIKRLANGLMNEHLRASEKLNRISLSKNIPLTTKLDTIQLKNFYALCAKNGKDFDDVFSKASYITQNKGLSLLQLQRIHALDEELKAYAIETVAVVKNNLANLKKSED